MNTIEAVNESEKARPASQPKTAEVKEQADLGAKALPKTEPDDQAKASPSASKDDQAKASMAVAKDSPDKAAALSIGGQASGVELSKRATELPAQEDPEASKRKVILKKTGFELPEQVLNSYVVKDGRYHDKASDTLRFQDHGRKLSTPVEDRAVIADMVSVAAAKNWTSIELKGSDTFKQLGWLEAESRGIHTKGYKPTEHDLQQLEHLKRERGASSDRAPDISKGEKATNSIEVSLDREAKGPGAKAERGDSPAPGSDKAPDRGTSGEPVQAGDQKGIIVGRLVDHGRANYNHDKDEKPSYYVVLETQSGQRTIWGKDLERSMSSGDFKPGDGMSLELKGQKAVTVDANVRDDGGKVVGKEAIDAQRNQWEVKPVGLVVLRTLSVEEKTRVDTAFRVLDKTLREYPADLRREIVGKFTMAVESGEMKLPMPQVAERNSQAKPVRQPEMDRSR